jgi:hypothetical protein
MKRAFLAFPVSALPNASSKTYHRPCRQRLTQPPTQQSGAENDQPLRPDMRVFFSTFVSEEDAPAEIGRRAAEPARTRPVLPPTKLQKAANDDPERRSALR